MTQLATQTLERRVCKVPGILGFILYTSLLVVIVGIALLFETTYYAAWGSRHRTQRIYSISTETLNQVTVPSRQPKRAVTLLLDSPYRCDLCHIPVSACPKWYVSLS